MKQAEDLMISIVNIITKKLEHNEDRNEKLKMS